MLFTAWAIAVIVNGPPVTAVIARVAGPLAIGLGVVTELKILGDNEGSLTWLPPVLVVREDRLPVRVQLSLPVGTGEVRWTLVESDARRTWYAAPVTTRSPGSSPPRTRTRSPSRPPIVSSRFSPSKLSLDLSASSASPSALFSLSSSSSSSPSFAIFFAASCSPM